MSKKESKKAGVMKRKRRGGLGYALLVLAAALILVVELLPERKSAADFVEIPQQLITATAEKGSITRSLVSAGSIDEIRARALSLAGDIQVESYLVNEGDYVLEGETVAIVDRDSVILAIAELTELMNELDRDINDSLDDIIENAIYAPMSGRVKSIYAQPGVRVQDTVAEHSALMRLSVDGLMAADMDAAENMHSGMELIIKLSDGTEIPGNMDTVFDGKATAVMSDEKAAYGERVEIYDAQGNYLAESELYIHKEIKISGIAGTVQRLNVEENMLVGTDIALIVLSDIAYRGERDLLTAQRREMEEELTKLFEVYNSGEIYALYTGRIVSLNDEVLVDELSSGGKVRLSLLSSTEPGLKSYAVSVTKIENGLHTLSYVDGLNQTETVLDLSSTAVFRYVKGNYEPASAEVIAVGDSLVLSYYISDGNTLLDHVIIYPAQSGGAQGGQSGGRPGGMSGGFGGGSSMGTQRGSVSGAGSAKTDGEKEDKYALTKTLLAQITPFDQAEISVTVDELDINHYYVGQNLSVSFDALPGQHFTGAVRRIDPNGSNDGGNTKYVVTVALPRTEEMLTGMNASVCLELETLEDVVTIPLSAIYEEGGEIFVYSSYDSDKDILGDPVPVLTGASDGERVEIVSGLEEGDFYYYRYADTIKYTFQ